MTLTPEQDLVLGRIFRLSKEKIANPVTIGAIHDTFYHMDVRDLVAHLQILLHHGLIENAGQTRERIGNIYVITPEGIAYQTKNIVKHPPFIEENPGRTDAEGDLRQPE